MQQMGGMSGLMGMLPGIAKMKNQLAAANLDERVLKRQMAIIDSMTPQERRNPDVLKASRKKRIAAGSGTKVEDINRMLKMHRTMSDMMKAMGSGKRGPMAGLGQHARARRRHAEPGQQMAESSPRGLPGGLPGLRRRALPVRRAGTCRRPCPACRRSFPAGRCFPGSAASRRGWADFPDLGKKK